MPTLEPNKIEDISYFLQTFRIDLSKIESITLDPNPGSKIFNEKFIIHFKDNSPQKTLFELIEGCVSKKYDELGKGEFFLDSKDSIDIKSILNEAEPFMAAYNKKEKKFSMMSDKAKAQLEKLKALKELKTKLEQKFLKLERQIILYTHVNSIAQLGDVVTLCMESFILAQSQMGSEIFSSDDIARVRKAREDLFMRRFMTRLDHIVARSFAPKGDFDNYVISVNDSLGDIIRKLKNQDKDGLPCLFETSNKLLETYPAPEQLYSTLASRTLSLNDVKQLLDLSTSLKKIKLDNSKIVQAAFQSTVNNTKEVALKQIKEMFTYFSDPKNAAHIDKNKLRQAFYASISERTDLTADDLKSLFAFVKSTKDQPVKLTRKGMMDAYYNALASRTDISFEEVKELYNFGYETKKSAFQKSNIRKFDTSKLTASILQSLKNSNNLPLNEVTDILLLIRSQDNKVNINPIIDSLNPETKIKNFYGVALDLRGALARFRNFDPDPEYRLKFFTELSGKLDVYNNLKNMYLDLVRLRGISPKINNQLKIVQGYIENLNSEILKQLSTIGFQSADPSADLKQEIARLQAEKEREKAVLEGTSSVEQAPDNLLSRLSNATQALDEMKKKKEKEDHPAIDETSKRPSSPILPSASVSVKPKIPETPSTERQRPKRTH